MGVETTRAIEDLGTAAFYPEPQLAFGHGQFVEDPRDGLTLFGPLDDGSPLGVRAGVIGTKAGIHYFRGWLNRIQGFLTDKSKFPTRSTGLLIARPPFPGFREVFRVPWVPEPVLTIEIPPAELEYACNKDDQHQRVYETVSAFAKRLEEIRVREETKPDLWFVVIPDLIYTNCRPRSRVAGPSVVKVERRLSRRSARDLHHQPSVFEDENTLAQQYRYAVDFRNQLKARLLKSQIIIQIVRESTIGPPGVVVAPKRDMSNAQAAIAWNLSTTAYYKAGFKPWRLEGIRRGVCYIGMVFKRDERDSDPRAACCAAQMFLDSGDGTVFRGAVGPWYSEDKDEFHLTRSAATKVAAMAISSYSEKHDNQPPRELFIHGKVEFSEDEWRGFLDAIDTTNTQLVGVKIRDDTGLRAFRLGKRPVMRGTAFHQTDRKGFLWTRGHVPRLLTYVGREVPKPLVVEVCRGQADLDVVMSDILALTKLNYNGCMFADGVPVTIRFANAVGEILTAAPEVPETPLQFRHYI
jgi:hypothetical protein